MNFKSQLWNWIKQMTEFCQKKIFCVLFHKKFSIELRNYRLQIWFWKTFQLVTIELDKIGLAWVEESSDSLWTCLCDAHVITCVTTKINPLKWARYILTNFLIQSIKCHLFKYIAGLNIETTVARILICMMEFKKK